MKISKQKLISILVVGMFLFSISIFSFQASNVRDNNENDEKIELLNVSYNFGDEYFNGTGTSLNVSLFGNRSETKALSINEEDLIISNEKNGWNMSEFILNFSDIRAERKYVKFETRNDGSIEFIGTDRYYAMSFEIPNTCILKNLSIFLQYPGGKGPQGFQKDSSFSITVYNSTKESGILEPHYPIHQIEDDINFDLSDENVTQPAKWYQSDFDDRILNISKTHNNTFFAVFQSIEYPSGIFGSPSAYIYYAEEQESDEYNIIFHEGSGSTSNWSIINHQNGMFKVNLAPLNDTPTPQEINLTVFDTQVNKNGLYLNNSFFPHINNEYYIPINSPWFGNIEVNVSFEGKFRYDRKSISIFKATKDSGVTWNSSLEIQEYNNEFYNKSAKFYKPEYWSYGFVYKNTELYEDINNQSKFIELNNISNATWIISYTQVNNIISPNYLYSSNENNWEDFSDKEYINASNYINITSTFNNSNGDALLYIYLGSSTEANLKIQQDITNQNHNFPLWSFKSNTSISENDTLSEIRLMTNNGTMAGIVSKSISVILNKNQTDLIMTS
ncbi:MAG: hypothetical protein GF311_11025, partial [Candidatus Lokiarchaeota archaeon]|nr:hypothetical protein [Candidatus Lokiarchaeota archaeon]